MKRSNFLTYSKLLSSTKEEKGVTLAHLPAVLETGTLIRQLHIIYLYYKRASSSLGFANTGAMKNILVLAGTAQLIESHPRLQRVAGWNPGQGTCPDCRLHAWECMRGS